MERIPILKVDNLLLITFRSDLYDELVEQLQVDLSKRISHTEAQGVMLDVSAVSFIDSFMGRIIGNIAMISKILDAETVVAGMQPAVAITLVELGVPLDGIFTALNVEHGIALLKSKLRNKNQFEGHY